MNLLKIAVLCVAAGSFIYCSTATCADVPSTSPFLSPLFTDNMVLQRGMPDQVWGWTTPGGRVRVSVAGKQATGIARPDGEWVAVLPPLPVGGPYSMTVNGASTVKLSNIMVGDVWLCSGQSNMEFGIGNTQNAAQEIANANYPNIRLFKVQDTVALNPTSDVKCVNGAWQVCGPNTVTQGGWNGFSAVGYFFGRKLYQDLHVPIGLVEADWGGTAAECWTSESALSTMGDFQPQLTDLDRAKVSNYDYTGLMAAWWKANDPGVAETPNWSDPAYNSSGWQSMPIPQYWKEAGIPALANFNGLMWYRKTIILPADSVGKSAVLHLGPVDDNDVTFVNGVQVGATAGYQSPRDYALPAGVLNAGANVIAVRVQDTGGDGGIWGKPSDMHLDIAGETPIPLAGDWSYRASTPLQAQSQPPPDIQSDRYFPVVLFNGMINPLLPLRIKGVIWYQGEANTGRAEQYKKLLPLMIGDWRTRWNEGDFPFYMVQLAGHNPDNFPDLREAQWETAQTVPNSGIATAIDVGNLTNVHPLDKQDVGLRLALVALAKTYGEQIDYSGPVYQSMTVSGSTATLTFTHLGGGLVAKDGDALTAFEVAGTDGKFMPADAHISGDTVVVSSVAVPTPLSVRYDWAGFPKSSLYNKAGLPCFPFRTDIAQR